jgi:hypothetical protein
VELERTSLQEWIQLRARAVRQVYTAFTALAEKGIDAVPDDTTPTQIPCPFHGADNKPSARYYPRTGGRGDYVRCYKCRENWDSINLYAKFRGLRFMDALAKLERRFRIKTARRPEGPEIVEPADRGASYVSSGWQDVPRVAAAAEQKLLRIRDKCGMTDYVKFCRVIDAVGYDFDRTQKATPDMVHVLKRLMAMMDEVSALPDDLGSEEARDGDGLPA